jgi:hypothetical protein
MNNITLLLLILFLGPFCSLPLGQARDFGRGKLEVVESAEKASVPWPTRKTNTMSFVSVVEARVFRFLGVEVAVKGVCFLSNLWDKVTLEEHVEVLWIVALGTRKHALVDELVDGLAFHDEGGSDADVGRVDEKGCSREQENDSLVFVVAKTAVGSEKMPEEIILAS